MTHPARWRLCTLGLLLPALAGLAWAGEPRDPMRPPAAALPRASGAATSSGAAPAPPAVRHLIWVDGQRYVVDGSRRRGVGDWLGEARIERIDDSAVLVRRQGQLLRLPLFAGVSKQPAAPAAADDPAPAATATATGTAARPSPAPTPAKVRIAGRTQP